MQSLACVGILGTKHSPGQAGINLSETSRQENQGLERLNDMLKVNEGAIKLGLVLV